MSGRSTMEEGMMTEKTILAGKVVLVTGQVLRVDGGTQCWPG
jgi:hypothetical protein